MKILNGISPVSLQSTRYLSDSLKKLGLVSDVVVYRSNKLLVGFEDKSLDIDLSNKLLFPLYACKIFFFFIKAIFKYDVFHFHFGYSLLPRNIDLYILRFFGKRTFMEYHGSDIRRKTFFKGTPLEAYCLEDYESEKKQKRIAKNISGILIHDLELKRNLIDTSCPVFILPLRLDLNRFVPHYPKPSKSKVVVLHSPSHTGIKGTDYIIKAINRLSNRYEIDFRLLQNTPNNQLKTAFIEADIIIDQLIIGQYGMLSIEAMAMGKPVVCFLDDSFFSKDNPMPPLLNANIHNIELQLENLISNYHLRLELGMQGRKFVEEHHNSEIVAELAKTIYNN